MAMTKTQRPDAETPSTTAAPVDDARTDLEIIDEGVAAFCGGDGQRSGELFELADRTDEQIGDEAAYQEAVGGRRLTMNSSEGRSAQRRSIAETMRAQVCSGAGESGIKAAATSNRCAARAWHRRQRSRWSSKAIVSSVVSTPAV
jgi:hypothetical protein